MPPLAVSILGTIPSWLTLVGVCAVAWAVWRGGGGTALATLQTANRVLERRIHELGEEVKTLGKENAELRGRTDVTLAMAPLIAASENHEQRAQERHEKTLVVLDLIAQRIGPEAASA